MSESGNDKPKLLGPAEIRELADMLDLQPTKKLGQNFVIDGNTVRKIVTLAGVQPGERVLEVGPGLGSLTLGILAAGASVLAVEIDARLAEQLPKTVAAMYPEGMHPEAMHPDARLDVLTADAMTVTELPGDPTRLVANLPYNVSVPVLLHLLEHFPCLGAGLVMVQSEVGARIAAPPGSRVYGGPSVKAAWYGTWRSAGQVSRQVFWPVPNVDSMLVSFVRRETALGSEAERKATFSLVDAAFGQRRKMLRQALLSALPEPVTTLERAGIDPTLRGEQLSVDDFLSIARVG